MRSVRPLCCFAFCCCLTSLAASAQEVVHAVEGTVQNIDAKSGFLTLTNNNGTGGSFKAASFAPQSIGKDLRAEVVAPKKFTASGDHVVLLYQGYGDLRSAVAVRDLGKDSVTITKGTVERYDKHAHMLTLKSDGDGKPLTLRIDAGTIADGSSGATDGFHFDASKGDHVKAAAIQENGSLTAAFLGFAD